MQAEFVIAVADVHCKWSGEPPRYRVYVNNELFAERTWIWQGFYLEENLQINAQPGFYEVRFELLDPDNARLKVRDLRVTEGPGIIDRLGRVQIYTPEQKQ